MAPLEYSRRGVWGGEDSMMSYGQFRFYNVGQGMFYVGKVLPTGCDKATFSFVYDCGATGTLKFLNDAIKNCSTQLLGKQSLDVIFVSHLDIDHVNGIPTLLKALKMDKQKHRVKTVVLPYFPLPVLKLIRLQLLHDLAFMEKTENMDELYRLVFNPYAYFLSRTDIGRLVVISPLDTESEDTNGNSNEWGNHGGLALDQEYLRENSKVKQEIIELVQRDMGMGDRSTDESNSFQFDRHLYVLNGKAAGAFSDMWRWKVLVPPISKEKLELFQKIIRDEKILNADGVLDWEMFQACCKQKKMGKKKEQERQKLLDAYDYIVKELRKSSLTDNDNTINMTSLILAHSPACNCVLSESPQSLKCRGVPSTVLFGDTDLANPLIYENILKGMRPELQKAAVLTVPHHGSRRNWNRDILSLPRRSSLWIATSGTAEQQSRFRHPDGNVVYDIWEASRNASCARPVDFVWNNERQRVDISIFLECANGECHWDCNVKTEQGERVISFPCSCWHCPYCD